jgi:GT2 family glycosyltransferase
MSVLFKNRNGEEYGLLGSGRSFSSGLELEVASYSGNADVLSWDDVYFKGTYKGGFSVWRAKLNVLDSFLIPAFDLHSKILVKKSLLAAMDTSNPNLCLSELMKTKKLSIDHFSKTVRYVGWPKASRVEIPEPKTVSSGISIVVSYRDRTDLTLRLLRSLSGQVVGQKRVQIILVNNQSKSESVQFLRAEIPKILPKDWVVTGLDYDAPYSHSAQTNLGVSAAQFESLILLNNDFYPLGSQVIGELADWCLEPGIATVGLRIVGDGGKLISAGMEAFLSHGQKGVRECEDGYLSKLVRLTLGNSFACAAVSKKNWELLGGLDSKEFPTQYNDADFCLKSQKQGFQHLYLGHLQGFHQPGQSDARSVQSPEDPKFRALCQKYRAELQEVLGPIETLQLESSSEIEKFDFFRDSLIRFGCKYSRWRHELMLSIKHR